MGITKTRDGRYLVGQGVTDGNEYKGSLAWRDIVIQLSADGATAESIEKLEFLRDYGLYHSGEGNSVMPPSVSVWISNNGTTTAVEADDITVDGSNYTICGIKWNGSAWDFSQAGQGGGGGGGLPPYPASSDMEKFFNGTALSLKIYDYGENDVPIFSKQVNFSETTQAYPYVMITPSNARAAIDDFNLDRKAKINVEGYGTITGTIFSVQGMPGITYPITVEDTVYVIGVAKTDNVVPGTGVPIFACGIANVLGEPVYGLNISARVDLYSVLTTAITKPEWFGYAVPEADSTTHSGDVLMLGTKILDDGREILDPTWEELVPMPPTNSGDYCLRVTNGVSTWVQINS